jgi:hypothetical protein
MVIPMLSILSESPHYQSEELAQALMTVDRINPDCPDSRADMARQLEVMGK